MTDSFLFQNNGRFYNIRCTSLLHNIQKRHLLTNKKTYRHTYVTTFMGGGDALWVAKYYWVNTLAMGKVSGWTLWKLPRSKFATGKPGVPLRIVYNGIILHTDPEIHPLWKLRNYPEGGHTIGHPLPLWMCRVIVRSKEKYRKYI